MGVNILESCVSYNVNILNCTNEVSTKLREIYQPEPEEIYVRVAKNLIDAYDVPSDAIDWESYELDEDLLYGILVELLGNHPYYLVFAMMCLQVLQHILLDYHMKIMKDLMRQSSMKLEILQNLNFNELFN